MASGIYFPVAAMGFALLTVITFYVKKPIKSVETKLYKYLLITNILGLILELLCTFAASINNSLPTISDIILKTYLVYNLIWTLILTIYVLYISVDIEILKKWKTKIRILISTIIAFSIYFIYSLECILVIKDNFRIRYTEGPSVNFTYTICGILIFLIIVMILKNINNLKNKKYIPIYIFLVAIICGIIIQKNIPGLLIMTYVETLTVVIMYHTIENPDMKILKEMHEAKIISDNANEEKTLFLYNITQEIRETTKNIDNDADMIIESNSLDENKNNARNIKGETSKFRMMTNDIFDISAVEASNIKIYNSKYNIKTILKEVINVYNNNCKNKGIDFRTNIEHNLPDSLYGDNISIKKALTLILTNSLKYTTKGYIELNVNTIIKNDICRLIITIEDSGTGIKSSEIEKIKVEQGNFREAYKLITLMNGTIMLTSNYGAGTKVKIILDQKMDIDKHQELKQYNQLFDNMKILIVDDNETTFKIIEKILKGNNIELDTCLNGKECLNKIKTKNKYNLILLDEELSQISGEALLEKLKEIRNFNIPVILLTKDNSYEYNEEYKNQGFDDYLVRPFKKEELLKKLEKYI